MATRRNQQSRSTNRKRSANRKRSKAGYTAKSASKAASATKTAQKSAQAGGSNLTTSISKPIQISIKSASTSATKSMPINKPYVNSLIKSTSGTLFGKQYK